MRPGGIWLALRAVTATLFLLFVAQIAGGCVKLLGDFQVQEGAQDTSLCSTGDHRCNDEYLLSCDDKLGGWALAKTCGTRDQCDDKHGTCSVCMRAGELRCHGAAREACDASLSKWEPVGEKCASPELCNPTGCGECPVPGALRCDNGTDLKQCGKLPSGQNGWLPVETCATEELCRQSLESSDAMSSTGQAACVKPACDVPGQLHCTGKQLERCRAGRDAWMPLDLCASDELCTETAKEGNVSPEATAKIDKCHAGCGVANAYRCVAADGKPESDKNTLEQCKADLTSWAFNATCKPGQTCDSTLGKCSGPCMPGAYRCNGPGLELCNDDGLWKPKQTCDSVALCTAQQDPTTSVWSGSCKPKVCPSAGTFRCNPTNGAVLEECNADLTAWLPRQTCGSAGLCNAKSKKCDNPACGKDPNGELSYRCDGQVVKRCKADFTAWEDVGITCKAGEYCVTSDHKDPCKMGCPSVNQCNQKELQKCTPEGWVHQSDCTSAELCQCALNKNCIAGTGADGCGVAVCGGTKPTYQCAGAQLQKCAPGRDNWWNDALCGSNALCYPGVAPGFTTGYCQACLTVGEVECAGNATHTCAPDKRSWTAQTNCAYGCVDSGTNDYCGVCSKGELRCVGDLLQKCSDDQRSLSAGDTCANGCVDNGTADMCAVCVKDEKRCLAGTNKLQKCAADRKSLVDDQTCANSCIDSGTNDYCGACTLGDRQCDGSGVKSCGADLKWSAPTACPHGCVDNGTKDDCAAECTPGKETRCSPTTANAMQTCGADGKWPTATTACANGCFVAAGAAYCGVCKPGDTQCASGGLLVCGADGKWPAKAEACAAGCVAPTGGAAYCGVCTSGQTQCDANGALQTCGTDKRWTGSMTCANGCVDSGTADYCGLCAAGSTQCASGMLSTCVAATKKWGTATTCSGGFGCADTTSCAVCAAGEKRCTGTGATSSLQTCSTDRKTLGAPVTPCPSGCVDKGTADECAVCVPTVPKCPTGRVCGTYTNSCGVLVDCGACAGTCNAAGTVCTPICVPKTRAEACGMQECGTAPDGCNGPPIPCGSCTLPAKCGTDNKCACTPDPKACGTWACGDVDNGCGTKVSCGTCPGSTCGTDHKCVPICVPKTKDEACGMQECGSAPDGCNGPPIPCGSCTLPEKCGTDNKCACSPKSKADACGMWECGSVSDGCKNIDCGPCPGATDTCSTAHQCVAACVPKTPAEACGTQDCDTANDGCKTIKCGANNGGCPAGETCGGGGTPKHCGSPPDGDSGAPAPGN